MTAADRAVRVVLVAAVAPTRTALELPVGSLVARGAHVEALLLNLPKDGVLAGLGLAGHRRLVLTRSPRPVPARGRDPRRYLDAVTYRLLRVLNRFGSPSARVLRAARRDPLSRAVLARADVLVAVDRLAVPTVRRLAAGRPAFYGIAAAVRHLDAQRAEARS